MLDIKVTFKYGLMGVLTYIIYLTLLICLIEIFFFKEIISSIISNIIAIIVNFILIKMGI